MFMGFVAENRYVGPDAEHRGQFVLNTSGTVGLTPTILDPARLPPKLDPDAPRRVAYTQVGSA